MTVIDFKRKQASANKEPVKPTEEVACWRCNCGCTTFFCNSDETIDCASCGTTQTGNQFGWRQKLPALSGKPLDPIEEGSRTSVCTTPDFAKQQVLCNAKKPEAAFLAVVFSDGTISLWNSIEDEGKILPLIDDIKDMTDNRIKAFKEGK